MMKKLGCLMALAGILTFVGAFALFGKAVWQAKEARKVHSLDLTPAKPKDAGATAPGPVAAKPVTSEVITVGTDKACQLEVELTVKVTSAKKVTDAAGDTDYEARYKFPFSYKVTDEKGVVIFSEKAPLAWDAGTRVYGASDVGETGGTMTVTHHLDKFDVPEPGKIKIEVELEPDTGFKAELVKAELVVFDNVARHARSVGFGVLMLFGGPVLFVLGGMVFLAGLLFDSSRKSRRR